MGREDQRLQGILARAFDPCFIDGAHHIPSSSVCPALAKPPLPPQVRTLGEFN